MKDVPEPATHWITHVQSAKVESLLKQAANQNIISFAGGLPADEMFPAAQLTQAFHEAGRQHSTDALQYLWT